MAFNPDGLLEFAQLCRRFALGGRCLTLGRQDVNMTWEMVGTILLQTGHIQRDQGGVRVPMALAMMMQAGTHLNDKPNLRKLNCLSDKALFAALGFASMESLDVSAYEGADFVYDLNRPGLGDKLGASYQVVFDPGTTEHAFDLPTAFENVHDVLAVGGVVVQSIALNNRIDHGFYQVSPDFLVDYYEANGYEILSAEVVRLFDRQGATLRLALDYARGAFDDRADGGLDAGAYKASVIARKTAQATKGRFPTPKTLAWAEKPAPFPTSALRRLADLRRDFGVGSACLTLGANSCFADAASVSRVAPVTPPGGALSDRQTLHALGFETVVVADCAPGVGVDRVFDVDRAGAVAPFGGPFDLVLDWGASSRVFRLADLFRSLFVATRVGGMVWHIVPTQNLLGRGHAMLCPTLLHDYYTTNGWEILRFELVMVRSWHDDAWFTSAYTPGSVDFMSFGGAPEGAFLTSVLVRRTADSTADRIPQQSWFARYTDFTEHLPPGPDAGGSGAQ